jgi:pyruvate/2-oxoglutarate dehydrogenase complex dihydrolipoamide acyltransferase (E2) component
MLEVRASEDLWASSMAPEGIVENWLVADASEVFAGDAIAAIKIEGALHEIIAPRSGRLAIVAAVNAMIEPGSVLATLSVSGAAT